MEKAKIEFDVIPINESRNMKRKSLIKMTDLKN